MSRICILRPNIGIIRALVVRQMPRKTLAARVLGSGLTQKAQYQLIMEDTSNHRKKLGKLQTSKDVSYRKMAKQRRQLLSILRPKDKPQAVAIWAYSTPAAEGLEFGVGRFGFLLVDSRACQSF